jgi:hypothetical protein
LCFEIVSKKREDVWLQESHGDWLACEHNSALANSLKSKYGE